MTRVRTYRRRTKRGGTAVVREHERKDNLHAKLGEETEEGQGQLLLTGAPPVKRRRRVKSRVAAKRKPAHVRRTRKVALPVEAPAPAVKVSRGRDIFGNTPNPYMYSNALSAIHWNYGYWSASDTAKDMLAEDQGPIAKQVDIKKIKGDSFSALIKNMRMLADNARDRGEMSGYILLRHRFMDTADKLMEKGDEIFKLREKGYIQALKDAIWKEQHKKQIDSAVRRLQRKVTVKGQLKPRDYEKIIYSAAFKSWFGDWEKAARKASRVVNEKHKPKEQREIIVPSVVYHGTPVKRGFTWFDPEKGDDGNFFGPGFYFTSDYDVARGYSEAFENLPYREQPKRPKLENEEKISEIFSELTKRTRNAVANGAISPEKAAEFQENLVYFAFRKKDWEQFHGDWDFLLNKTDNIIDGAIEVEKYLKTQGYKPHKGTIYTVFLNIRNPYNLDEIVKDKEIDDILALGKSIGGDYNEFHFKHLWDEMKKEGQEEMTQWLEKTGRVPKGKIRSYYEDNGKRRVYYSLEGHGADSRDSIKKIWELLVKYPSRRFDSITGQSTDVPLRQFKPGGKSGILTRQMLFRMLADWGWSDRGATLYTNYIKSKGYDGITHTGGWNIGTKDHKVWIAFEPEQVKSTLNEGTFNPNDPDMFKGLVRAHRRRTSGGKVAQVKSYNRKGRRTAGGGKRVIKPSDELQLFNLNEVKLDLRGIKGRRFIYNPKTKDLVIGEVIKSSTKSSLTNFFESTHSIDWFHYFGTPGDSYEDYQKDLDAFDKTIRGWIGFAEPRPYVDEKGYKNGFISFTPTITDKYLSEPDNFDMFWDTIEMFLDNGITKDVILQGFKAPFKAEYRSYLKYDEVRLGDLFEREAIKKALVKWRANRGNRDLAS